MLLNYDDVGPGPVVVLLHGFPFDHQMWNEQKTAIGALYRVITPDLRGHGSSMAPPERVYHVDTMADDVIETIEAIGIEGPVLLGGLSMGGYVALSIAVRFPTRIRGLLLFDTRAAADTPEARENRLKLAAQVEEAGNATPVVDGMLPRLFSPTTRRQQPILVETMAEHMMRTAPRSVAATLRGLAERPDRTDSLPGIAVPTLVVVGADDEITPPAEARAMAAAIPGARLVAIPGAGHMAPLEQPGPVNQAILAFLKEVG